jgi:glycogen debranching enzyme
MKRVGFLFDKSSTPSPEEHAAWKYLSRQDSVQSSRVSLQSLNRPSGIVTLPHLLWWHFDSSTQLPLCAIDPRTISALRKFVQNGGSLFLSLLASPYVVDLGIEELRPNEIIKGTWDKDSWAREYPDIRGFAAYRGHPLFEKLPGGVYTWNPTKGSVYSEAVYRGQTPVHGSIVGVERTYIQIDENCRIISEFELGKGKILTVGAYFYFKEQHHRFRSHLEFFAANCVRYLLHQGSHARQQRTYWNFGRRIVQNVQRKSKPFAIRSRTSDPLLSDQDVVRKPAVSAQAERYFAVGGRRILIAGKERGGITEVWCHPVRILRNVRIGFKVGQRQVCWAHERTPKIVIQPEFITRTFQLDNATVQEIVFGDSIQPSGAIHFRTQSKEPLEIIITASIDLRMMWPLSSEATGSLQYTWDEGLRAAMVMAPQAGLTSILGSSVNPIETLVGQYSQILDSDKRFVGKPTRDIVVTVALRFRLERGLSEMSICFAGSGSGTKDAERAYRTMVRNPGGALRKQSLYYRQLIRRSTRLITPDLQMNEAYRWGLTSTDRFVADTPGLGSSLMAGYGSTEVGWNGGHAISGRPGYAWYFGRDSVWTSLALLCCGNFKTVRNVLEFLGNHQDPDGKIPHEVTTSGYAHYDAADSTPLYVVLMGQYLRASGDIAFVRSQFNRLVKAMDFCFSTDTDRDHLIENTNVGHGWVEGGSLFPVHCEHYLASCWAKALTEASYAASALRQQKLAQSWAKEAKKVTKIVSEDFWNERTQFYNFGKLADGSYNEEKTLLPAVGIVFGLASPSSAVKCLEAYASDNFSADWGTRIVGKDNPKYNPTGYHYGSIWPLFTGWTSLAEFKMARPLQGYMHAMNNLLLHGQFSAGHIEEVLHGEQFRPAGVCPHQAWSESMALQPLLEGMLGIEPDAIRRRLKIRPYFPPDWKKAEVLNVVVGRSTLDVRMSRDKGCTKYEFQLTEGKPMRISFQPYFSLGTNIQAVQIDARFLSGKTTFVKRYEDCPVVEFRVVSRAIVQCYHSGGVALVPPVPYPVPMQESQGLRVIDESREHTEYALTLEGMPGKTYSLDVVDPDTTIRSVRDGKVVKRVGERVTVAIEFEKTTKSGTYVQKQVFFNTI